MAAEPEAASAPSGAARAPQAESAEAEAGAESAEAEAEAEAEAAEAEAEEEAAAVDFRQLQLDTRNWQDLPEAPEGTFEFRSRVAEIEPVSRVPPPKPWP